ncbi:MAG: PIG-L family deacetylase [Archangium sp.]|nr:PIG-L family deacetylase [Archangium sp.]
MLSEWLTPTAPGECSAVFVLAHPDDEFFCMPLITAEVLGGRTVQVVYLTDGGPLASTRERESLKVLGDVGVGADFVRFAGREHGWRDGHLHEKVGEVRDWLATWLAESPTCARLYVPAWEGGHHDHDCCFGVVASLLRDGRVGNALCLQFPLYNGEGLRGPLFRCMRPLRSNGEEFALRFSVAHAVQYLKTARAYPSQWRSWVALGPASAWAYLVRRSIVVQRVKPARLHQPPHAGVAFFERRFGVRVEEVLEALRRL